MAQRTDYLGRDGYTWWVGEVEDIEDPSQIGRVKVRILGWYTGMNDEQAYLKELPTTILPWATVLLPCDQPQTKATGTTTELQPGAWVLGFFLDGEEAQLPVVMGAFRGFAQEKSDGATTIADATAAVELQTDTPQQTDLTNVNAMSGNSFPKNENTPASLEGAQEEARGGGINMAEAVTPGNSVTNSIKPPTEMMGIGDGVAGPAGGGFEKDLKRMLTELGNMSAALGRAENGLISLISGKTIAGDKIREHLGKTMNFLSGGIAGILAPLKEVMAKLIAEVVGMLVKIISSFVPLIVVNLLMSFLDQIFALFCAKTPMWLGLVKGALSDTANFANQMASLAIDKIATSKLGQKIDSAVKGVSNRILEGITGAMNRVKDVAGDVISAISTAKGMLGKAMALGETVQSIFEFDFTSLDWGSLLQILMAILGALFKKSCNRKIKRPKSKGWFPLIGSTECDNIEDAIKGTPYANVDDLINKESGADLTSLNMSATPTSSGEMGSYIDQMFKDTNPYLMQVTSHLSGTRIIDDATPKKEKRVVTGPGGVSSFEDKFGNIHRNIPNNETKIIAKDKCENIKGNYCLTVEGDFYVKVMGNMHQEVACLLYTSPSPRDRQKSRMPSSA